jgi:hypothetical protein
LFLERAALRHLVMAQRNIAAVHLVETLAPMEARRVLDLLHRLYQMDTTAEME